MSNLITRFFEVVITGFEPVTSALSRRRSKPTELNDRELDSQMTTTKAPPKVG